VVVSQFPVSSLLRHQSWWLKEVSTIECYSTLVERFELGDDEGVFAHLISKLLLFLISGSDLFQHALWLLLHRAHRWHVLACKVGVFVVSMDVSSEFPNENTVMLPNTEDLSIVSWVEGEIINRIGVSDEALEVIRNSFLRLIIPDFQHVVFATGDHIA